MNQSHTSPVESGSGIPIVMKNYISNIVKYFIENCYLIFPVKQFYFEYILLSENKIKVIFLTLVFPPSVVIGPINIIQKYIYKFILKPECFAWKKVNDSCGKSG